MRVYIAGPYTGDGTLPSRRENVRVAVDVASQLMDLGYDYFLPHLSHFVDLHHQQPYEKWLKLDFVWLAQCEALLRIPGNSPGADREVEEAHRLGIPVFYSVEELTAFPHIRNPRFPYPTP